MYGAPLPEARAECPEAACVLGISHIAGAQSEEGLEKDSVIPSLHPLMVGRSAVSRTDNLKNLISTGTSVCPVADEKLDFFGKKIVRVLEILTAGTIASVRN
jgi:hypothetical protein